MKNKLISLIGAISLVAISAHAQVVATNSLPSSFVNSLASYFTSQNTNLTFNGTRCDVSVGADYTSGQVWAQYVSGQYQLGTNSSWSVVAKIRNDSIAGVIKSTEIGVGYTLYQQNDTQITASLLGGYDREASKGQIEPTATLRKKATANTYFETGISMPVDFGGTQSWVPNIFVGTGFTF